MVALRFLRRQAPYNAGEIAGFAPEMAARLVKGGVAVLHEAPAEDEADPGSQGGGGDQNPAPGQAPGSRPRPRG